MTPPVDDWTLLAVAGEERSALEMLFRRHRDTVFRFAYARLRDVESANDLTQEVFLRLARYRRPVFRGGRFTTWLYRVTANLAADEWRRRRREPLVGEPSLPDEGREAMAAERVDCARVLAMLALLPRRQREAFELRILEEWSVAEAAAAMGVTEGSVKTHLHRALNAVRRELELR